MCDLATVDIELGLDEISPLGITPRDAIDPTTATATLAWSDGATTTVTVSAAYDGEPARYLEPSDPACEIHIEAPVVVDLATADGRIGMTLPARLWATTARVELDFDYYATAHAGTLDIESLADPAAWDPDTARVFAHIDFAGGPMHGALELVTHRETGSEQLLDLATW